MRIETLGYFLEIARCGSFTQAADNLFISQQGLSKAIKSLEGELDASLFVKDGRRVVLSEEGEILCSFAKEITAKNEELKTTLLHHATKCDANLFRGRGLALCAMPYVCNSLFNLLHDEMDEYGLCDCAVREHNLDEILSQLNDEPGFALISIPEESFKEIKEMEGAALEFIPLFSMEIMVVVSQLLLTDHSSKMITPDQLMELPLAYYNEPVLNEFMERFFGSAGLRPSSLVQHTTNCDSIRRLLRSAKAATFSDTFSLSVRKQANGIAALKVKLEQEVCVGFLMSRDLGKRSLESAYIRRFQTMLKARHKTYLIRHSVPASCSV